MDTTTNIRTNKILVIRGPAGLGANEANIAEDVSPAWSIWHRGGERRPMMMRGPAGTPVPAGWTVLVEGAEQAKPYPSDDALYGLDGLVWAWSAPLPLDRFAAEQSP